MKSFCKKFCVYFLLPFSAILVTLGCLELIFICFYPVPYSYEYNGFYVSDPYTAYKIKPHYRGKYHNGIPVKFNSLGLKEDEFKTKKNKGAFRILVLGDSFTVGTNLKREHGYPKVLETILNNGSEKRIEVINAGVDGWNPFQYAQYYKYYGRKIEHDMVILGFFVGNDVYDLETSIKELPTVVLGRRVNSRKTNPAFSKLKISLYKHLNIARIIINKAPPLRHPERTDCTDFSGFLLWIQKHKLKNHLKQNKKQYVDAQKAVYQIQRINDLAAQSSIPLVLVMLPDEDQVNPMLQKKIIPDDQRELYDFTMPQTMLKVMFYKAGVTTIDLLPDVLKSGECLYMNDTHFNPAGQLLTAKVIAAEISGLLTNSKKETHSR
jgi:hypothetical protein